ncbi:cell division protein HetF [Nodularia spumigena]|uniref:cell division protein HetF n=2 Tax=Nodularia spumigena TaxID=70799 RepID=UPI00232CD121|nr:cell division protein HetF [Nodularia spumigena]MDB9319167.1 CHAT domain-containing protein [Nodularia spumigena CS-590/01A]MDB9324175.1 CHAT domain-containing protein [Nodularia spumigena CS-591/07A]MDB9333251.1 CHAT domain-containing protein [Nodularia spumigena CS-591/04]MDB9336565.1 CHAT domain-containing protein [Nodularia spumigena CS-590/01]MDB9358789.1 CHAT domain-containing protein [Nodularia spumigena CS-588/02]
MTQEFHISVTPVGQNDYLVRTEQVAPGVPLAEELVTWPVTEWLASAAHLMNDPLKSVLQGEAMARNSVNLVELGQKFYNALFQGTLRDSWITAQGIAQNHQQVLRLRLGLKDIRLARLPWEVMHAGDRPLATGPYIAFSRYQTGMMAASGLPSRNRPTVPQTGGVKVLMVLASPPDQVRLDLLKQEAINLQAELHRQTPQTDESGHNLPDIELTLLDQPGREELTQALEQGRYQVLHYSGHSNLGPNGGQIYLVSRRTGLSETLSGDDLAGLLVNNNIQMAVFNSCWGAYTATSDSVGDMTGERNLTESLVRRGIRGVLAMSERIPDEVALTLTQLLYRNLSQGYPVDLCVSRVRQGLISAYGSHQSYWALPTLYLQQDFDGRLCPEISSSANSPNWYSHNQALRTNPTAMYFATANDTEIVLPIDDMIPSGLGHDSSGLDWLGEETWGDLVDEIEYDDDPHYAEDSALVSDLFRQLDHQKAANEQLHLNRGVVEPMKDYQFQEYSAVEDDASLDQDVDLWGEPPEKVTEATGNSTQEQNNLRLRITSSPVPSTPKPRTRYKLRPIVSIVGASALAALTLGFAFMIGLGWWKQNRQALFVPEIGDIPTESLIRPNQPEIDIKQADTGIVTAKATEKLSQGDLQEGLVVVEELLNRGALRAASAALNLIPENQLDDPSVNFFKGRLAWQFVQTGNQKYSIDDVRRYWQIAVKSQPESILYNNALGFAYYAENDLNRANNSWFKALDLALKQQNTASIKPVAINTELSEEALTSYAGLALGLYKSAYNQPGTNKQKQYLNEAIKLRQMVITNQQVNFQINELSKNWLWSEKAIADWRSLLQAQGEKI